MLGMLGEDDHPDGSPHRPLVVRVELIGCADANAASNAGVTIPTTVRRVIMAVLLVLRMGDSSPLHRSQHRGGTAPIRIPAQNLRFI